MNLGKQKILIIGSVVLSVATAYSFYHSWKCDEHYCFICSASNGLALITGTVVGVTVYQAII